SRDILHMRGVDQQHLDRLFCLAQGMEHRSPEDTRGFHAHMGYAFTDQPVHHLDQGAVVGVELAYLLAALTRAFTRGAHRYRNDLLADIDRGDPLVDDLHIRLPPERPDRRAGRGTRMKIKSLRLALTSGGNPEYPPGRAPASIS